MTHLTTPELIRALGGADAICKAGCSCRGSYQGPERRSVHRDPCPYCGGTGTLVYEDEAQPCYCQQADADVRA